MTKDDYESAIGAKNLARWKAMAEANGKTGEQLAASLEEFVRKHCARICEELGVNPHRELDLEPVSSVAGNVMHADFKNPRRAIIAIRAGIPKRSEIRRPVISKIMVPSTSPELNPAQNTVFPYSIR